jgi:hypothetical protein
LNFLYADRLELLDLEHLPAILRVSFDELASGQPSANLRRIRGSIQQSVIEAFSTGESCEWIAERLGRQVEQILRITRSLPKKIKEPEKCVRHFTERGT